MEYDRDENFQIYLKAIVMELQSYKPNTVAL